MSQSELFRVMAIFGGLFFLVSIGGFVLFVLLSKKEKAKRARDIEIAKARRPSSEG
jgi:preprotein translocase subunit SecG